MEVGQQAVDRLKRKPGVMNRRVSPRRHAAGRRRRPRSRACAAPWSRPRRPGRRSARARSTRRRSRPEARHSPCIRCPPVSCALTGRKVPAPTCRVTKAWSIPRSSSPAIRRGVKCRAAVGAATAPARAGEHGLIVGAVARIPPGRPLDVRRQRHLPERIEPVQQLRRLPGKPSVISPPSPLARPRPRTPGRTSAGRRPAAARRPRERPPAGSALGLDVAGTGASACPRPRDRPPVDGT